MFNSKIACVRCKDYQTKSNFLNRRVLIMAGGLQNDIKESEKEAGRQQLERWLNRSMKINMSDGRTLIGIFLCTDKDGNVILGTCEEYIHGPEKKDEEPRVLGLAMVPGHHIMSIHIDQPPESLS